MTKRSAFSRISASILAVIVAATFSGLPVLALTINAGDTMTVESINGAAYTYSEAGDIIINGTLQGFDRITSGGAGTGHGANITLTSSAGQIIIGPTGRIIINGTIVGGHGGSLILNASSITIDGIIQANGLGAGGAGGTIQINGSTLNLGSTASISAMAGNNNALGGSVTFNCSGLVTINSGAAVSTKGESNTTHNLISISGSGVNMGGVLNAQSRGTTKAGKITIAASTGTVTVTSSGSIIAAGYISNNGGNVVLTGNVNNQGVINAAAGTGNATGGAISITGGSTKSFTQSGSGRLYANANSSSAAGNGGNITINTGSVTVNNTASGASMDVSGGKLATSTGNGGHLDIRATNGNLNLTDVDIRNYGDSGTIYLRSNTGDVNIGSGAYIYGFGDGAHRMDLISSAGDVNVNTNIGMDGIGTGNGGIVNISAAQDFNMSTDGYLSARGSFTNPATGTDGGSITVNAANINLNGAAKMRAYGTQYQGAGNIGYGGVIDLNATNAYYSESGVILNAGGARAYSGPTITKNVIDIAANSMTVDGRYMAHGRNDGQDGGRITFTSTNALTLAPTASLEAYGDLYYGGAGGAIYLNSLSGNVNIQNGAQLSAAGVLGQMGGLMNISAGNNVTLNAITLDASGSAGGSILVDAGNALSYGGSTFMANGLTGIGGLIDLTSGGVLTVDNTSTYDAGGTGSGVLSFTGTSVNNSGTVTVANGDVQMSATTGNINNTGNLNSGTVHLTAANGTVTSNATHTGEVYATGRTVSLTNASGTFNVGDVSATAGNTTLTATTGDMNIASTSAVSASNTLTATAATGNITTNGNLTGATGGINLTASGGNITGTQGTYSGRLNATARSIDVASSAGSIQLGNLSATAGTLGVSANAGSLSFAGGNTLSSTGDMTLRAGTGSITAGATTTFSTPGNLNFSVANNLTLTGDNTTLNPGAIRVYGNGGTGDAAGNVSITKTAGDLNLAMMNATGNHTLAATGAGSNLTLANATTSGGTTVLQADTQITATSNNFFNSAVQAYGNTGTADYVGTVDITSQNTTTGLNMTRLTATNANLNAINGSAVMTISNFDTDNGVVYMTAKEGLTLSNSTVDGTDAIRMRSNNNGNVSLTNNTIDYLYGRTSIGVPTDGLYVDTAGAYAMSGNTFTGNMDISTNDNITMTSGSVAGTMMVVGNVVNMTASSGNMNLLASTAKTGSMTLNAQAGNIVNNGTLSSTNANINLTASGNVDTYAAVTANAGSVTMTSTAGDILIDGNVTGGTGITMNTNGVDGDIVINAFSLNARAGGVGRDIVMNASDDITFSGNADINAYGLADQLGGRVQITAGGDFVMDNTASRFNTYGLTDATHNRIEITAQNITTSGDFLARGQTSGGGGEGGYISMTSTTGDINIGLGTYLNVRGYAYSDTRSGNAGTVVLNAARDLVMDGQVDADSTANAVSEGLLSQNNGGTVLINTGRDAIFNYNTAQMFDMNGAGYGSGTFNGGDGGTITVNATNNITFNNVLAATNPSYMYVRGGTGQGAGSTSGNGGTINLNHGGSLTIDNLNPTQQWRNFDIRSGVAQNGSTAGSYGTTYDNGTPLF
ncbi:MAG: beta strand repeat-containing protein [Candidatus Melainabacteria bacterium]